MPDSTAPTAPRVIPLARLAAGGRWRVEAMRALSEPVLYWFTKGQGRITAAGTTRGYQAHNAVFLPPGCMHGFEVPPHTFGHAVYFGRHNTLVLPQEALHLRCRETAAQMELTGHLEALTRELQSEDPASPRAALAHLQLIGVWLERQSRAQPVEKAAAASARRLAARYSALLEREFRTGQGIAEYARQLGVTPTHLSRVCRQSSERTAHELLQDRRLYEARQMLADPSHPIGKISADLGFRSAAYFTRAFRQATGKSPSDFRRSTQAQLPRIATT